MKHQVRFPVSPPADESEAQKLCGGFDERAVENYWDAHWSEHASFLIAGATEAPPQTVRLWEIFTDVSGSLPDLTPQPTGNCVAAAADDVLEFLECLQIHSGALHEYKPIYNPFHYATGRELILKGQLRGGAGSVGGAQAKALEQYGAIAIQPGLPDYTKANVNAWGDGKPADGRSYKDYLEQGKLNLVRSTARINSIGALTEAIGNLHPCTIASNRGYAWKPDKSGFHQPSGKWAHQMSLMGYSLKYGWIAIKNQWGNVHGRIVDEDGCEWPPGFLRVRLDQFEKYHLRGSETIAYSRFDGFPQQRYDHSRLGA